MNNKQNNQEICFAISITTSEPDLELHKVYQILPDELAAKDNYVRVVDESGEDYLYPSNYFVMIELPQAAKHTLLSTFAESMV